MYKAVQRLVILKQIRKKDERIQTIFDIDRPQQYLAVATHIILKQVNIQAYTIYAGKGQGPFDKYVAFEDKYFGRAYSSYSYSSIRAKYNFK